MGWRRRGEGALFERKPPVHHQHLPGHVAGVLGAEEGDDLGDIGRLRHPAQHRCFRARSITSSGSIPIRSVRMNPGATALTLTLDGPSSTAAARVSPDDAGLARRIVGHPETGPLGLVRADIDDLAVLLLPEDRRHGPDALEGAR